MRRGSGLEARPEELIALNEALRRLETIDERQGRVVELRYFGGLTIEETAQVLSVSIVTVKRDWALARACTARFANHWREVVGMSARPGAGPGPRTGRAPVPGRRLTAGGC
jgi:hypothetical protein